MSLNIDVTKDFHYMQGIEDGKKMARNEKVEWEEGEEPFQSDLLYIEGIKVGKEMARKEMDEWEKKYKQLYRKLLTAFPVTEIATEFNVSVEYLESLKKEQKQP